MKELFIKKRGLILFLTLVLVLVNTGTTFAYWATDVIGGNDSSSGVVTTGDFDYCNPIYTAQEFYDFATSSTSSSTDRYCLMNDIDFSSFNWEYLAAFNNNQFQGYFDGKNHTISNITMNTSVSGTVYLSLFSRMNGGTIKNLKIENYGMGFTVAYYNSSSIQAGILAGEVSGQNNLAENITITNADVIGSSVNGAGGLFGQAEDDASLTIRNVKATNLTVLNSSKRAGGLVSRANPGTGQYVIEDIDLQGYIASGYSTITNTGGIFGTFRSTTGTIDRVIVEYIAQGSIDLADGTITYKSNKYVGGFIGNDNAGSVMTISNAFYTGELYNNISYVGSVLGNKKADIPLDNVYYSNVLFVDDYVASTSSKVINGTVVNATSMPSNAWWDGFYTNFDSANDLWTQDASGRPVLIRN
jgi:hypothetical protein